MCSTTLLGDLFMKVKFMHFLSFINSAHKGVLYLEQCNKKSGKEGKRKDRKEGREGSRKGSHQELIDCIKKAT